MATPAPIPLTPADLTQTARAHLKAARVLRRSHLYDSAVYLCGYAVEIALKARICRALKWTHFPSTKREFETKTSVKTHDFEALLDFTSVQARIKQPPLATEWETVKLWTPEQRYQRAGSKTASDADDMILATKRLLDTLL